VGDKIVYLPSSVGELYDKITILEIKAERVVDPQARSNVMKELAMLLAVEHDGCDKNDPQLRSLIEDLRLVNTRIWETEDKVRALARDHDFGPKYVEAARGSYTNNDDRARLKREINALAQSAIVEVKYHG
jgi:hypothetical protein